MPVQRASHLFSVEEKRKGNPLLRKGYNPIYKEKGLDVIQKHLFFHRLTPRLH